MENCSLCNEKTDSIKDITEEWLIDAIKRDHPEWVQSSGACPKCFEYYSNLEDDISVQD